MFDFLIPNNPASLIMLVIVLFLLWGTIKTEKKESILREKRHQEEKERSEERRVGKECRL